MKPDSEICDDQTYRSAAVEDAVAAAAGHPPSHYLPLGDTGMAAVHLLHTRTN